MCLFHFFNVSSNPVLIIRRINCVNTSSGIYHSVYVAVWYAGQRVTLTCIPDLHSRHRVTYTRRCIDTIDSTDDEHWVARNI